MGTDVEQITSDYLTGFTGSRPRTCTIWDLHGTRTVETELAKVPGAFILCEYPERPYRHGCAFEAGTCRPCRIVLAGLVNDNPALTISVSTELQHELGARNRLVRAIDLLAHFALVTGDPELVSAVARLASPAAVS